MVGMHCRLKDELTCMCVILFFLKEVEIRNKDLEGQLSDLEQRLEKSQNEQEAFRSNLKTLLEILDGKIFELTELRDNLAKLLECS
jgi:homer protein